MATPLSRKQTELLATAKALARGLSVEQTANEYSIHPAAVAHHRRRLGHLRLKAEALADAIAEVPADAVDGFLLCLFQERKREQKQRSRAARLAKGGVA